jgi:hypothetical protein
MAVGGLQAVRDALIFAYAENLIDDEEFALLYDHNRSKPLFPYWKFDEFNLDTWTLGATLNVKLSYGLRKKIRRHLSNLYAFQRNSFASKERSVLAWKDCAFS